LEEECLNHEIRKRNRIKKLETIKNILYGNEYSFSDFKVDQEEIKEFIPETPLQGVLKIKESLNELKAVLKGSQSDQIKKKEYHRTQFYEYLIKVSDDKNNNIKIYN
jgi:ribosomal protein L25 (general stress protein Ctc)